MTVKFNTSTNSKLHPEEKLSRPGVSFSFKTIWNSKNINILLIFFTVLDLVNVKVYVGDDAAECTLTVDDEVMVALGTGKLTTTEALAQDKLDIDGDLALATKLAPFVQSL